MKQFVIIKKSSIFFGLIVASLVLANCGTTAPFKSRDAAQKAIERSETVEAPVYAETLYGNSKKDFDEGQALIVEDKKSGKNKKANKFYINAKKIAEQAYEKAIVPFTKAIIDATAVALEEAKVEKIDRASETLYEQAANENKNANNLFDDKKFSEAQEASLFARATLDQAVAEARRLAALIKEQQRLIEELKARALQMKATNATPDEWEANIEFYESVLMTFEEGYYLVVFEDNKELIEEFENLIALIEEKKQEAIRELAEADRTIDQLKGHRLKVDQEISRLNKEYQDE